MKQIRNTQQRQLVRNLLTDNYTHPTADEVYELAREENPSISRGTIYRNLNLLANSGEIIRLSMPAGPDHFDCMTHNHYHFVCQNCYKVIDTDIPYNESLNSGSVKLNGCKVEWHKLVLVGLCPDCNT